MVPCPLCLVAAFPLAFPLAGEARCFSAQVSHLVWPGTAGFGQCVQRPSSLASRGLAWIESRCCSLRSGVLFLFLLYPRRFSFLASTRAGVGSTRGSGVLGVRSFGTTFLGGFRVEGFWV